MKDRGANTDRVFNHYCRVFAEALSCSNLLFAKATTRRVSLVVLNGWMAQR